MAAIQMSKKANRFVASFDETQCSSCSVAAECPAKRLKRKPIRVLRITQQQVDAARRVHRSQELQRSRKNPRTAVEAAVWSIVSCFPHDKVPVRGHPRVATYVIATAVMANVRRLLRARGLREGDGSTTRSQLADLCPLPLLQAIRHIRRYLVRLSEVAFHHGIPPGRSPRPLPC
ncbi:MAG: transposase [Phycisphaerae bacterium]